MRERRIGRDWTLEDLAHHSGLSPNYLGTIENGRRDPSLSSIEAIAGALEISVGELLGGVEGLSPDGIEAARLVDQLPSETRRALITLLRELLRSTGSPRTVGVRRRPT